MNEDVILRQNVMLSVQRALLGNVTSNLRGVGASWNTNEVRIFCFFDGPISEEDEETMGIVQTEVATDFVDTAPVHFELTRLDRPAKMQGFRAWVFLRKE